MGEALIIQLRKNPVLTRLFGYRDYCFYDRMPKGDISTRQQLRHVPYFDLKQAYSYKENRQQSPVQSAPSTSSFSKKPDQQQNEKDTSQKIVSTGYLNLENTLVKKTNE